MVSLSHPLIFLLGDLPGREGVPIGRRHAARVMKRLGIEAIYRRPNTSKSPAGHKISPYLLRGLKIERSNQVLRDGNHLHPDGAPLRRCSARAACSASWSPPYRDSVYCR